mmetsp:Transcript_12074/g.35696  ORF Transcript_12074/g.35696 Transcript_12074/m.35696 type:complete len:111 (+) Transcript_12074:24-356(+)
MIRKSRTASKTPYVVARSRTRARDSAQPARVRPQKDSRRPNQPSTAPGSELSASRSALPATPAPDSHSGGGARSLRHHLLLAGAGASAISARPARVASSSRSASEATAAS